MENVNSQTSVSHITRISYLLLLSGRNGSPWVGGSDQLNNDFYRVLLRRNWVQQLNPQGLHEWREQGSNNVYLNSDIALFKDIDDNIVDTNNGEVSCTITSCADNDDTLGLVQVYSRNNQLWLDDFADVFEKMIQTGYDNLQRLTDIGTGTGTQPSLPPVLLPPSPPPTIQGGVTSSTSTSSTVNDPFLPTPRPSAPTRRPRGGGRGGRP